MGSLTWHQRFYKIAPVKTHTYSATGDGNGGTTTTVWTVTGRCLVRFIVAHCTASLTSGGVPTISLGTTNQVTRFIGATTATGITTTANLWVSTTPTQGSIALPAACVDVVVSEDIITDHLTADLTAGGIEFYAVYVPLTDDGALT